MLMRNDGGTQGGGVTLQSMVTAQAWVDAKFPADFSRDRRKAVEGMLARQNLTIVVSDEVLSELHLEANPIGIVRSVAVDPKMLAGTQWCVSMDVSCWTEGCPPDSVGMCYTESGCPTDGFGCPQPTDDCTTGCDTSTCQTEVGCVSSACTVTCGPTFGC